jgi:hypothetical protein
MAALLRQNERDLASIFMNIKVRVKPIQNAHILTCMLRFRIGLRLALNSNTPFRNGF